MKNLIKITLLVGGLISGQASAWTNQGQAELFGDSSFEVKTSSLGKLWRKISLSQPVRTAQGKAAQASEWLGQKRDQYFPTSRTLVASNSEADQIATGFANEFAQVSYMPESLKTLGNKVRACAGYVGRTANIAGATAHAQVAQHPKAAQIVAGTVLAAGALFVAKKAYDAYQARTKTDSSNVQEEEQEGLSALEHLSLMYWNLF